MPASMIMAPAGFIRNVSGSSMAMVAGGPSPGMIPTTVPSTTPAKHHSRLAGCSATANPCIRPERISTLRERNAERQREQDVERRGARQGHRGGDPQRPAIHHRNDEEGQCSEADDEADEFQRRYRYGEREPGAKRADDFRPIDSTRAPLPKSRNDQDQGKHQHRDAVPERKEPGARPLRAEVLPARRGRDDVRAKRAEREPGPEVRGHGYLFFTFFLVSFL